MNQSFVSLPYDHQQQPKLNLYLLGTPKICRHDKPITGLPMKSQALLCYLAMTRRPQPRAVLATLLWGDSLEKNARASLRKAIQQLHQILPGHLILMEQSVVLQKDETIWVDAVAFTDKIVQAEESDDVDAMAKAISFYRGDFLSGFLVRNAPDFETWQATQQIRLREQMLDALQTLSRHWIALDQLADAIAITRRIIELEPWREQAHRQLIELLARNGERGAALAHFDLCREALQRELDVEPGPEISALYEQIRAGAVGPTMRRSEMQVNGKTQLHADAVPSNSVEQSDLPLPIFFTDKRPEISHRTTAFIARTTAISRLDGQLTQALAGKGQIACLIGQPGSGKSALAEEFVRRALVRDDKLIIAKGSCHAFTGVSDPYFPFREIMSMLMGDVESRLAAGSISRDHALRLWHIMPMSVKILLAQEPELFGNFISTTKFIGRVRDALAQQRERQFPDWLSQVIALQDRKRSSDEQIADQSHIFEAITNVLVTLAAQRPLLLVLDDLHWADISSISLLFHLSRHIGNSRIFIIGTCRPEEVALGRDGARHPLADMLAECKRTFGEILIDLDQESEGFHFVQAILQSEPNRLNQNFHRALFHHTRGHALFTIELLRELQTQGTLRQDESGYWVESDPLDWNLLPAKVEGVIEKRIGQLTPECRELLVIASIEGEEFTAQVISCLTNRTERAVFHLLSHELEKRHFLVQEQAESTVAGQCLSRYRFGHVLFQHYIYQRLSAGERRLLHGEVASALERLYGNEVESFSVQLAHHYRQAEIWSQAFDYLLISGHKARGAYATQEAIAFYTQAIAASRQIAPPLAASELLPIYEGRGVVYMLLTQYLKAIEDFQIMLRLARSDGNQRKEGEALCHLAFAHWSMFAEENAPFAEQYGQEAFLLAQEIGDERILAKSLTSLGFMHQWRGKLTDAAKQLEASLAISRRNGYHASIGQNLLWLSVQANWQGNFQASVKLGKEGLAVSRDLHDGLQELFSLAFLGLATGGAGHYRETFALFQEGIDKAKERENLFFIGRFANQLGWFYSEFGDNKRALELDLESLEFGCASGVSNVEISALINVGLDNLALGRYAESQSYLEPTLERVRLGDFGAHQWRWLMRLLIGLAELAYVTGDYAGALSYVDEGLKGALNTGSQKYIAKGQGIKGKILLALKQPTGGLLLQEAVDRANQVHSPGLIYPLAYELAQWQESDANWAGAEASYRCALAAIESMAQTIDDKALVTTFHQSETVQAVRNNLE